MFSISNFFRPAAASGSSSKKKKTKRMGSDGGETASSEEAGATGAQAASSHTSALSLSTDQKLLSTSALPLSPVKTSEIADLYGENAAAKIWRVASSYLEQHPNLETYPEYVPATGEVAGTYQSKPAAFWTCGFFPASLYCLLERSVRFPDRFPRPASPTPEAFHAQLLALCRAWSDPLHKNAVRTNSHDLGFIMRSLRMDWELTGNTASLRSYVTAAESLATRYDARVGAIRSWDQAISRSYKIVDRGDNFLVIIDSMCNMDLLFYAAHHTQNSHLSTIAAQHAHTVLRTLVRPDSSTWHVASLDQHAASPDTVKFRMTHQGYADGSTWARGQAWGILGFVQSYGWTADPTLLDASVRLAERFLAHLARSPAPSCRFVPLWDFGDADADLDSEGQPLRDTSAGLIAANGLLLLHQAMQMRELAGPGRGGSGGYKARYLEAALYIVRDTIAYSLDRTDRAVFTVNVDGEGSEKVQVPPGTWDAILRHSTANNNRNAVVRYSDHGLVYADYYFLEFGNKLLRMGLV